MSDGYVLVIGSAGVDVKGMPEEALLMGVPNQGRVRHSVGGVARNIAENLARLEEEVILLTALGEDARGQRVYDETRAVGVNCDYVRHLPDQRTGTYLALLKPNGELEVAISDFAIMASVDAPYLRQHEALLAGADLVVVDATLSDDALAALFDMADEYDVRVCADPTTPSLSMRFRPYLPDLFLLVPNAAETQFLCDLEWPAQDRETGIAAARQLVALGTEIAVVTMGDVGTAYADSSGGGFIRAVRTHIVDATGAGDALSGAVIWGLLNDVDLDEAMKLGVTAATLTLQSRETVLPELTQEFLYDNLVG